MFTKQFWRSTVEDLKVSAKRWFDRDPIAESSVIAYCTIFSLPGLLVIVINVVSYFIDREKVTHELSSQIQGVVGQATAKDLESIVAKASETQKTVLSSILSVATLLIGATGVFNQLQKFLNAIWEVPPVEKQRFLQMLKDRLFSFGLILVVGFLLLVSLALSALLATLGNWVTTYFSESLKVVFRLLDIAVSLSVITLLFAAIYKFLPDAKVRWRDVWFGSLLSSFFFVIAKFGLAFYFAQSKPESAYGAAGSIVLVMLWVSYSSIILLFGAEFTHVDATRRNGNKPTPPDALSHAATQNIDEQSDEYLDKTP